MSKIESWQRIKNLLIWLIFISLCFILQISHFLEIKGINPNLILVALLLTGYLKKSAFLETIFFILFSAFFIPYWFDKILILSVLAIAAMAAQKILTSHFFIDFPILIILTTLSFYLATNWHFTVNNPLIVATELTYNLGLGIILFSIVKFLDYQS